ncbi:hypothetical protein E4T56_gene18266 [Termitomyces sp. T112]|nr:hypothetical protein C0989_008672 [Termitomyces sp. Mn162]KAG5732001.1 hypothetical protein E4T56_gene18266 [Termitomyces sp. T112]KAH0585842.1 hypothetical protein H2248_007132 [Termitomyces sp. 'cryptogamus']
MSDQPLLSKPKPGSLRDRIAAFEKSAGGATPAPTPVPRPKPGGISWKPKSPSPPTSPSAADVLSDKKTGNTPASDAKESIKSGGTLKERMAALQNRGGFGAPPPVVPKPPMEKPKWKPPPAIVALDKDDDEPLRDVDSTKVIPLVTKSSSEEKSADEKYGEQPMNFGQAEGEEAATVDSEEEERQRRAVIAARMARLGGARVGMAPMFGLPASMKKSEHVDEPTTPTKLETSAEKTTDKDISQKDSATPPLSTDEPSTAITSTSDEEPTVTSDTVAPPSVPKSKDFGSSPSLSTEAETQGTRPPISMPVPSAPRRAAPPRRKAPKTPETPHSNLSKQVVSGLDGVPVLGAQDIDTAPAINESTMKEHAGDVQEELDEIDKVAIEQEHSASVVTQGAEDMPPIIARDLIVKIEANDVESNDAIKTPVEETTSEVVEPSQVVAFPQSPEHPAKRADEEDVVEVLDDDGREPTDKKLPPRNNNANEETQSHVEKEHDEEQEDAGERHVESQPMIEKEGEPVVQTEGEVEEDEEVARRKRIAEKLAKMGGVNPFSFPQHQTSEDIETSPTLTKRSSIPGGSVGSPPPPPPPQRKQSSLASVVQPLHVVEPSKVLESELVADSPASPQITTEYTDEPVTLNKRRIEPEYDTRQINQDAKTDVALMHTSKDDIDAREGYKTDSEWVIDPIHDTDGGLPNETLSDSLTRSISIPLIDSAVPIDPVSRQDTTLAPSSSRRSLPPPLRLVSEPLGSEEDLACGLPSESSPLAPLSPLSQQPSEDEEPPRRLPPRHCGESTDDDTPPLPVLNRRSMQCDDFIPPSGERLSARPSRPIPLLPTVSAPVSDAEDSDFGEVLPTPPRRRPATPATPPAPPNEIPLIVPPPVSDEPVRRVEPSPLWQSSHPETGEQIDHVSPSHAGSGGLSSTLLLPLVHSLSSHGTNQEVLDEEEGDPIDPSFHSPSRRTSFIDVPPAISHLSPEQAITPEEDEQAARRKTIAERMAKLGGIKFGAAPLLPHVARSPPPVPEAEEADPPEQPSGVYEEEEQARKERIAAKLVMMGGMRIGLMPSGAGAVQSQAPQTDERPPALPSRVPPARPPPTPQTQDIDEQEGGLSSQYNNTSATSDEGSNVEIEDSELEEVSHADVQEMEEEPEEVPPPVPARGPRRREPASESEQSGISHLPRSPAPTSFPTCASIQSASSIIRQSSVDSAQSVQKASTYKLQSEYVMVEEPSNFVPEEEEEIPPPPPARPSYRPPPRVAPPPPPPTEPSIPILDSISSRWEMPSMHSGSIEFSTPADISLSWPEDSSTSSSRSPRPSQPSQSAADADVPLSADDLMTVWGRVGVQICEVATTLFEKSKKSLIGDGTYDGFIRAVLSEVPNAAMPISSALYGHLIYAQTGNTLQKRESEILPGDIMMLQDAKLKGHKGLQPYHQNVGIGEPLVGVVSEFEPKKLKVRLFQANQHVGQQTVEAVSYRLEDLKSGTAQIFRVLEN